VAIWPAFVKTSRGAAVTSFDVYFARSTVLGGDPARLRQDFGLARLSPPSTFTSPARAFSVAIRPPPGPLEREGSRNAATAV
jgi:hypothetical protein